MMGESPANQAVRCSIAMQKMCQSVNARRAAEEQIILCCGVGFGKILKVGDEDVFGHEVNIASKLGEDTAKGSEILVTRAAKDAVTDTGLTWEELHVEHAGESMCWRAIYAR
jgi:adenylate cyclase